MLKSTIKQRWVLTVAWCWSWLVIALGAFTRLTDSGLGCPDWPGCYGHLTAAHIPAAMNAFRAWAEMSHRYVAGILVLLILMVFWVILKNRRLVSKTQWFFSVLLFLLLIYQPILGMWTVTMKLYPAVVSQHLLSGISLMLLIGMQWLYFSDLTSDHVLANTCGKATKVIKVMGVVVLSCLYLQLSLGAWTSTNYAATACDVFPFCHMSTWHYEFKEGFNWLKPLGLNYSGGSVSLDAKRTIQVVHRCGALLLGAVIFAWLGLVVNYASSRRYWLPVLVVVGCLFLQIILGILTVYFSRPLLLALLHTLTASALCTSIVYLNMRCWAKHRLESQ